MTRYSKQFFVIFLLVFIVRFQSADAQKLPSFITPCSLSDPNSGECLRKAAQGSLEYMAAGLPNLGVPPIDPLEVDDINIDQSALKVKMSDPNIQGLKSCIINELRIDPVKKRIYLNYTKNGSFNAKYDIDGRILIIPIRGTGDSKIKFTNLNYYFKFDYDTYTGSDGKEHWKIVKHKLKYKTEKAFYIFTNLFNGNKQLADTALQVVNSNWQIIFNDMSPQIMTKVTKAIVNAIDKFFESVPVEEMVLP